MKRPSLHAKLFHNGQHKSIRAVKSQAAINEVPNRSPNWSPTSLRRLKAKLSSLSFSSSDPDKLENSLQTYLVQAPEQPSQDTLDSLSPLGTFSPRRSKFSYSPVDSYFSVTCDSAPEFLYHFQNQASTTTIDCIANQQQTSEYADIMDVVLNFVDFSDRPEKPQNPKESPSSFRTASSLKVRLLSRHEKQTQYIQELKSQIMTLEEQTLLASEPSCSPSIIEVQIRQLEKKLSVESASLKVMGAKISELESTLEELPTPHAP